MIKKLSIFIFAVLMTGCKTPVNAPLNIKPFENTKTYDLSTGQVIEMLGPKLDSYLKSTSAKTPKIESKSITDEFGDKKPRFLILATDYSPKDSKMTACRGGRFWGDGDNGLDHGVLGVIITSLNKTTTTVEVKTAFIENNDVNVIGRAVGYVRTPYGATASVHKAEVVDVGSHCYSTGVIEETILGFIKSNTGATDNQQLRVEDRYAADISAYKTFESNYDEAQIKAYADRILPVDFTTSQESEDANNMGVLYASGVRFKKNEPLAFKLFNKAAFNRDGRIKPNAMNAIYNLGIMYESGRGTKKNATKAVEYYQMSAAADVDLAQLKLGYLYANGLLGLSKDERKAAVLFTNVAKRKMSLVAFYNLGYMYSQGLGVHKNDELAYICYKLLAEVGEAKAQASADALGKGLTTAQLARAKAYMQDERYKAQLEGGLYQ